MVNLEAGKLRGTIAISAPSQRTAEPQRKNEMEWEEALSTAWGGEIPPDAAAYYRRQAARARRVAEGATTQAVKARLLDLVTMTSLLPRPMPRERKQRGLSF
jgi:hypothetical protein